jgi:hypothetical protein
MKTACLTTLLVFCATAFAMVATVPPKELVAQADLVLVARTVDRQSLSRGMRHRLAPLERLKGFWPLDRILEIDTLPPSFEDAAILPPPCRRVVLFLKADDDGKPRLIHGRQGAWPLDADDRLLGFGTGLRLQDLKRMIDETATHPRTSSPQQWSPQL